jgi:protein-S-isoprenylcysteine O-methyltransferase Ste14
MNLLNRYLRSSIVTVVFLAILILSAGRLDFWQAWLYAGISLLMNLATLLVLRGNPDLSNERSRPGAGMQSWDKALLGTGLLLTIATQIVAGLDSGRFHWSPDLSWTWSWIGAGLSMLGTGLFLRAMKENRFFSAVVRIQGDRGHSVCATGPYRVVRHPGYAGMIIGRHWL